MLSIGVDFADTNLATRMELKYFTLTDILEEHERTEILPRDRICDIEHCSSDLVLSRRALNRHIGHGGCIIRAILLYQYYIRDERATKYVEKSRGKSSEIRAALGRYQALAPRFES